MNCYTGDKESLWCGIAGDAEALSAIAIKSDGMPSVTGLPFRSQVYFYLIILDLSSLAEHSFIMTNMTKFLWRIFIMIVCSAVIVTFFATQSLGNDHDTSQKRKPTDLGIYQLSIEELVNLQIVTASKFSEPAEKAPGSVTVITADDIRRLGARTIFDALRTVPGIGITRLFQGRTVMEIRGGRKDSGSNILFLLNGHRISTPFTEDANFFGLSELPLHNIKRIEVVRGPSSALYGTNAFLGVVNIITKSPEEIDGLEVFAASEIEDEGSIGDEFNITFGKRLNDYSDLAININTLNRGGPELRIVPDTVGQSGNADGDQEQLDIQVTYTIGNLTLTGRYFDQNEFGSFAGTSNVLSPRSNTKVEYGYVEAGLNVDISDQTKLILKGSIDHFGAMADLDLLPAGADPSNPFNATGLTGGPSLKTTTYVADATLKLSMMENHVIIAGVKGEFQTQHDVKNESNFFFNNLGQLIALPSVQDVSEITNFNRNTEREVFAGFIQDSWDITDDLRLTTGIRIDSYSDFGESVNPRVGLSWDLTERENLKIVYGTAFQAPDFQSLFLEGNPSAIGNPNLDPEEIETIQVSIGSQPTDTMAVRCTYFHNELDDIIDVITVPGRIENFRTTTIDGIEVEMRLRIRDSTSISANYTFIDGDHQLGGDVPDIPQHRGNLVANFGLSAYTNLNLNVYWQTNSPRETGDPRDDLSGYYLVDSSLLVTDIFPNIEVQLTIKNLFDKDYDSPAAPGGIAGDLPEPGRSFLLNLRYKF